MCGGGTRTVMTVCMLQALQAAILHVGAWPGVTVVILLVIELYQLNKRAQLELKMKLQLKENLKLSFELFSSLSIVRQLAGGCTENVKEL